MSTETETVEKPLRERPEIEVTELVKEDGEGESDEGFELEPDEEEQEDGAGTETGEEAAGDDDKAKADAVDDDAAKPEPVAKDRQPWHVKRIGNLTRKNEEAAAALKAANDKIAAMEAAANGGEGPKLYTEDEVRSRINSESTLKAKAERTNERLENLFETGTKAYKDFGTRVEGYVKAFGSEALAQRPDFFEAVSELPNGADVIHNLSGDLDHMAEFLEMPAYKMGMALKELSMTLAKPKSASVSKAPAPIVPLETKNNSELALDDPKLPMAEYVRRRQADREANAGGRRR